jgi:hypothetical protein
MEHSARLSPQQNFDGGSKPRRNAAKEDRAKEESAEEPGSML